jgi:hypothetical protein
VEHQIEHRMEVPSRREVSRVEVLDGAAALAKRCEGPDRGRELASGRSGL